MSMLKLPSMSEVICKHSPKTGFWVRYGTSNFTPNQISMISMEQIYVGETRTLLTTNNETNQVLKGMLR